MPNLSTLVRTSTLPTMAALAIATAACALPSRQMEQDEMGGGMQAETAAAPLTAEQLKFFESKIRPILIANCYGCHSVSSGKSKGGLRLDTRDGMLKGGDSGPSVVPGDVDSSLLIRAIRYLDSDYEMPPAGKLKDAEIALLEEWVAMGAPDPRVEGAAAAPGHSPGTTFRWTAEDIANGRENHWAYKPLTAPRPPATKDAAWSRSPIDSFILAGLEAKGLAPAADANPATLLRRASLDLTGLPPSREDVERFVKNPSPEAFARAVDKMLESPQFGERWGRHWLDVARYAESSGKESNIFYPHAWRYRDYVIQSFNEDKPYDRFLVEQLAGDLMPAATDAERAEQLIATGYLAVGTKSHNARGRAQFQMDLADEQIDAVTQGMLGLTVACARCHDHKFDPIPQKDYYAVAGIFLSTETRYGTFEAQGNNHPAGLVELPAKAGVPLGPAMSSQQRSLLVTAKERAEQETTRAAELREQARTARQRGEEPPNLQQQLVRARAAEGINRNLGSILERYDDAGKATEANLLAMGAAERTRSVNARLLDRGELDKPGVTVPRGFVKLLSDGDEPKITNGSGRLEFAQWIADEENPLTARVWANRVWLHLFGEGLVPTPDNFGMSGQAPTNPELLDHLASRLIAHDWSTKKLVREIMLSRAYAMSSAFNENAASIDPDNTLLWRMPKKRLEAEAIRDSMLLAAGLLDLRAPTGSRIAFAEGGMRGPQQERLLSFISGNSDNYRSVYLPIVRDRVPESLEVFDFAEPAFVTGQRDVTNVPTQALYLMNSAEMARISDAFAARVVESASDEAARITLAFELAFGRKPTGAEIRACRDFLDDFTAAYGREQAASNKNTATPDNRRASMRERARARLEAARAAQAGGGTASPRHPEYSALCQALLLSGEFRSVD
ncbi:MAG: hypothetical protein RLY21_338 [Planctomycetota bacterium]|jgi:cytochrome c553